MKRLAWQIASYPAAAVLWLVSKGVLATCRLVFDGEGAAFRGPAVFVNWHRDLAVLCVLHGHERRWLMQSGAPYMAPIARWSRWLGIRLVRGASGERGREALAELAGRLAAGDSAFLAVDGPAGPAFRCKHGCVELARMTGAPVIPVAVSASRVLTVRRRWDQMQLPLPFSTVTVRFGAPIPVAATARSEEALAAVQSALDGLAGTGKENGMDVGAVPP